MEIVIEVVCDIFDMILDAVFNPVFDKLASKIKKKQRNAVSRLRFFFGSAGQDRFFQEKEQKEYP